MAGLGSEGRGKRWRRCGFCTLIDAIIGGMECARPREDPEVSVTFTLAPRHRLPGAALIPPHVRIFRKAALLPDSSREM